MPASALPHRAFVGRVTELEALRAWRSASSRGQGTLGLIVGEAGIGKSRLVGEFCSTLRGGRAPLVVAAECLERAPSPLAPWRAVVTSLERRGVVTASALDARTGAVFRALVESPLGVVELEALDRADVFSAILAILASVAARRALVIAIEDLHWADRATLDVIAYLAPRIASARLLIITTLREIGDEATPIGRTFATMERANNVRRLALEPLGRSDLRALLNDATDGPVIVDESDLAEIMRRSAGNPLFAEELLKRRLDGAHGKQLPRTVRALLDERVRVLDEDDRNVLVHAAVLGERFDVDLLASILQRDPPSLEPALRRARDAALVLEEPGAAGSFRFRHALMRESLVESMLAYVRRPLHERIARALDARPDRNLRLGEIAGHWWEVGDRAHARRAAHEAGDAAMRLHAYLDAAFQYERALTLADDPLERARLHEALGNTYRSGGVHEAAIEHCLAAAQTYAAAQRSDDGVRALVYGCAELCNAVRTDEASAELRRFLAQFGESMSPRALELLESNRALFEAERIDRFPDAPGSAMPLDAIDDESRLRMRTARLVDLAKAGRSVDFLAAAEELVDALARARDVRALVAASTYNYVGLHALHLGERDLSQRMRVELRRRCAPQALRPNLGYATALEAIDAYLAGRLETARHAALAAAADAHFATARAVLGIVGPFIGLSLGDERLVALTVFEPAAEAVLSRGLRVQSDLAAAATATAWIAIGRVAEARAVFDACAGEVCVLSGLAFVAPGIARHASGAAVERLLDALARLEARTAHPIAVAVTSLARAIASERFGQIARAHSTAADAATTFAELGWPMFEAQALELAGEREAAARRYEACGASVDARRCGAARGDAREQTGLGRRLSPRERAVANLVAAGMTNRAIGERLHIGEKTVEGHLASIYRKLGLRSRAQLAATIAVGI